MKPEKKEESLAWKSDLDVECLIFHHPIMCRCGTSAPEFTLDVVDIIFAGPLRPQAAKHFYQRNNSVKHMVNRVRRDPNKFKDYQHNRDLVALMNLFADASAELPRGWESKKDKGGKVSRNFLEGTEYQRGEWEGLKGLGIAVLVFRNLKLTWCSLKNILNILRETFSERHICNTHYL